MARTRRLRLPVALATVVVLGGGGTAYATLGQDDAPRYRTVTARTSDVEQTLSSSGVVDAAARADLGFGTDGTVARLRVALGDTVKAGQVLASLDTTDLDAAVTEAEAGVARAVAQLASDRAAQTSSISSDDANGPGSSPPTAPSSNGNAALLKQLTALQDGVVDAQSAASQALAAARTALTTQVEVCAATTAAAQTENETDGGAETPSTPADDACAVALAGVADQQQAVSEAQDALATALDALAGALTKALASATVASDGPSRATRTAATPEATSNPSSSAPTNGGATVTAARLASDQAQIEQAEADLVTAQQNRAQAVLRSTRSGTVVAVDAAAGDAVTAGTTVVTVVGGKAVTVVGSATETQRDQLEVGQRVRVTVPGSTTAADGRLTAIGLVADTSSGSAAYPFTVTVADPAIALPTGSRALLEVVVSTASDVVTVPTSAVTRNGAGTPGGASVQVIQGSKVTRHDVVLGAVGTRTVQIASGLAAGQRVVLAAIDDPIEGADSELDQRGGFGVPPNVSFRGPGGTGGGAPVTFSSRQ